jgi:DNA-binding XRE family transcriptional regulator
VRCLVLNVRFSSKRPNSKSNITIPTTIGEHIQKKRLEQHLTQTRLSELLNITSECLVSWERGYNVPNTSMYPRIIEFLGYVPFETKNLSFPKQLIAARKIAGLTQTKLAKMIDIRWETIRNVELKKHAISPKVRAKLEPFVREQLGKYP